MVEVSALEALFKLIAQIGITSARIIALLYHTRHQGIIHDELR